MEKYVDADQIENELNWDGTIDLRKLSAARQFYRKDSGQVAEAELRLKGLSLDAKARAFQGSTSASSQTQTRVQMRQDPNATLRHAKQGVFCESNLSDFEDGFELDENGAGMLGYAAVPRSQHSEEPTVSDLLLSDYSEYSPSRRSMSSISSASSVVAPAVLEENDFDLGNDFGLKTLKAKLLKRQELARKSEQTVRRPRRKPLPSSFRDDFIELDDGLEDIGLVDMSRGTVNENVKFGGSLQAEREKQQRFLRGVQSSAQFHSPGAFHVNAAHRPPSASSLSTSQGPRPSRSVMNFDILRQHAPPKSQNQNQPRLPKSVSSRQINYGADWMNFNPQVSQGKRWENEQCNEAHSPRKRSAQWQALTSVQSPRPLTQYRDPEFSTAPKSSKHKEEPSVGEDHSFISHRRKKNVKLIKYLAAKPTSRIECNGMVLNPASGQWEGNYEDAHKFETVPARLPKLIRPTLQQREVMGSSGVMVLDKDKLCWVNALEQDDNDPFDGIEDLDPNQKSTSSSRRLGASSSGYDSAADERNVFQVTADMLSQWSLADSRFSRKFGAWVGLKSAHSDLYDMVHN